MWGRRKRLLVPGYTKAIRQFIVKKRAKKISRGSCSKGLSEKGGDSRQGDMSCMLKKGEQKISPATGVSIYGYTRNRDVGKLGDNIGKVVGAEF